MNVKHENLSQCAVCWWCKCERGKYKKYTQKTILQWKREEKKFRHADRHWLINFKASNKTLFLRQYLRISNLKLPPPESFVNSKCSTLNLYFYIFLRVRIRNLCVRSGEFCFAGKKSFFQILFLKIRIRNAHNLMRLRKNFATQNESFSCALATRNVKFFTRTFFKSSFSKKTSQVTGRIVNWRKISICEVENDRF